MTAYINNNTNDIVHSSFNVPGYPLGVIGPLLKIQPSVKDLRKIAMKHYYEPSVLAIDQLAEYALSFLSHTHPDLGRPGDVCPFTRNSIEKGLLFICSTHVWEADDAENAVAEMALAFLDIEPKSPRCEQPAIADQIYKSIIIAFPNVKDEDATVVIDQLQRQLKARFIANGLMIGQFHPNCPEKGLHNSNFRPLQAPVPSLAIRHITKYDAPFMLSDLSFIKSYLKLFGNEGETRINKALQRFS